MFATLWPFSWVYQQCLFIFFDLLNFIKSLSKMNWVQHFSLLHIYRGKCCECILYLRCLFLAETWYYKEKNRSKWPCYWVKGRWNWCPQGLWLSFSFFFDWVCNWLCGVILCQSFFFLTVYFCWVSQALYLSLPRIMSNIFQWSFCFILPLKISSSTEQNGYCCCCIIWSFESCIWSLLHVYQDEAQYVPYA